MALSLGGGCLEAARVAYMSNDVFVSYSLCPLSDVCNHKLEPSLTKGATKSSWPHLLGDESIAYPSTLAVAVPPVERCRNGLTFRAILDLQDIEWGYVGLIDSAEIGFLRDINKQTEAMYVEPYSDDGDSNVNDLAFLGASSGESIGHARMACVRVTRGGCSRTEISLGCRDGSLAVTLDGVEVIMPGEYCAIGRPGSTILAFVWAAGSGGLVQGDFKLTSPNWIEELSEDIEDYLSHAGPSSACREEGKRLMQLIRDRLDQGVQVERLLRLGERLGTREECWEQVRVEDGHAWCCC